MNDEDILKSEFGNDIKIEPCIYIGDNNWVKISLTERLFSWPWRPWVKGKWYKGPVAYFVKDRNTVIVSCETYSKIMKEKEKK